MCNKCIHKIVCTKYIATGGVKSCEHHKEERKGVWEKAEYKGFVRCSRCKDVYINEEWLEDGKWNACPNCGADMRGEKDENT